MEPTIGRIVIYKLTEEDSYQVNRRRTTGGSIRVRMAAPATWPQGAQAHIGEIVFRGEEYPMIVVVVTDKVSGQVFLNGNDVLWVKEVVEGQGEGQWHWPERK